MVIGNSKVGKDRQEEKEKDGERGCLCSYSRVSSCPAQSTSILRSYLTPALSQSHPCLVLCSVMLGSIEVGKEKDREDRKKNKR